MRAPWRGWHPWRLFAASTLAPACVIASAATWQARPGQALQPIIDAARAGDVIEVQRGFYPGNLRIAKPLTLKGIERPTISGGPSPLRQPQSQSSGTPAESRPGPG